MQKQHIVATWPKTRPLSSYLQELGRAERLCLLINFRVARLPNWGGPPPDGARMYMVHEGYVRGYNLILRADYIGDGEISRVENDAWAGFWPAGNYVVRYPNWYPAENPTPMKGFQGWRWYDESARS